MSTLSERTTGDNMVPAARGRGVSDRSDILRRALIELKAAHAEADEARLLSKDPIAVVGLGCRFPGGASGAEAFWDLLVSGRSGVVEVPADRWSVADFFDADPDAAGRTYSRHGGFVEGIREFDAGLFGVPPREAAQVDPQHRLVLEVAWEALEHGGIAPDSLRGSRTGVFVGMGGSDYERLNLSTGDVSAVDGYTATGSALNMAANRLSYVLGLEGPSLVVDTACSSSLVAVHLACQSLRAGECDMALVAGVNTLLSPGTTVALSKGRMLSPDGLCKTFDAGADGYVRGEGCGVVVLRRLSTARERGQRAWAVIKGSAINQDGKSSGLTVPRASAQEDVVRRALDSAGVCPSDVGYVEAHGTGTALGDPIEVRALASVLGQGRDPARRVALGSVKTNIGHLEAAAGIAGLIKAVLTVERGVIPPHLNVGRLNPHIAWDELPVTVPTAGARWPDERRVAGVSSFGFGGTNAHVVLESAPAVPGPQSEPVTGAPVVVKVSGRGDAAVREGAARLASWVRAADDVSAAQVAWAAGAGRADLPDRAAVVAGSMTEIADGLEAIAEGLAASNTARGRRSAGGPPRLGFAPSEQGPWLAGALAGVYGRVRPVTEVVDAVAEVVGPVTELPLSVVLDDSENSAAALEDAAIAQPVLFTVAVALGRWWQSIGVRPDAMSGHGAGAYAAAVLAGALSLADGMNIVTARAAGKPLPEVSLCAPHTELVPHTDPGAGLKPIGVGYLQRQADESVPHSRVVSALTDRGIGVVIELGPGGWLPSSAGAAAERDPVCVASAVRGAGAHREFLESVGRLWTAGVDVDWTLVNGPRPTRVPVLPTYPFQRQTYWPAGPRGSLVRSPWDGTGGLRPRILRMATGETVGETEISLRLVPFLDEHRVHNRLVVPGVLFLELVLRCADEVFDGPIQAQDLSVSRSLVLGDHDTATVQVIIDRPVSGRARARVFSRDASAEWQLHFETVIHGDDSVEPPAAAVRDAAFAAQLGQCTEILKEEEFYSLAWHPLFRLGESFRLVRGARRGTRTAVGTLVQPRPDAIGIAAGIRPELLLLDACIQLVAVAAFSVDGWDDRPVHLGTGYERVWVGRTDQYDEFECVAVLRDTPDGSVIGDLRLFGDDGRLVAQVWGASFRPVSERMLAWLVSAQATTDGGTPPRRPAAPVFDFAGLRTAGEAEFRRAILDYLAQTLAVTCGFASEEVETDAPVVDLADSLMIAELRSFIERDLAVSIAMEDFFDGVSLLSLVDKVTPEVMSATVAPVPEPAPVHESRGRAAPVAKRAGFPVKAKTVGEMTELAELAPSITASGDPESVGVTPDATLLTGGSGFVGAFLLAELLNRRHGEVFCLVRADDASHARRRIFENLKFYGIDSQAHLSRIVPVVGDLAKPLLGLGEQQFAALHTNVGDIVHCGGMVKWTYPYGALEAVNVGGTREVLRLATVGAPRPVHFISTVGVFSSKDYTADSVTETVDIHASGSLVVGYAQTKWVAERMVRFAHERGVPVTIHRINTGGHSVTGAFNRLDHLTLFLKGCIEAGIAPESLDLMPVQPAPVDYVASAVVELSSRPELDGGTFHLVNAHAMTWKELFDSVEEFGYPLDKMPLDEWRDRITGRNAGTMALLGLAPFLRDSMDHVRLPFSDSTYTRSVLREAGLTCPRLNTELVHTFLRGFVNAAFIDPPGRS